MDIKELRIGNSVLCNGVRAKVIGLQTWNFKGKPLCHVKVKGISPETGEEVEVGGFADTMQPIPITEELLKELGFEVRALTFRLKAEKYLSEYDEFLMLERMKGEDKFDVYLYISKNETHRTHLKYLHELEIFVFMATKKELI